MPRPITVPYRPAQSFSHNLTCHSRRSLPTNYLVERTYDLPPGRVFELSMKAIKSMGYQIDNYNEKNGLITFHTGTSWRTWAGQDVRVSVDEQWPSGIQLSVYCEQRYRFSIWDMGEARSIANKIVRKLEELLNNGQQQKSNDQ